MKLKITAGQIGQVVNIEGKIVHVAGPPSVPHRYMSTESDDDTTSETSSALGALRALLIKSLRIDSDLDAFCIDHFPAVSRKFTQGMDSTTKINILFQMAEAESIGQQLRSWLDTHSY